MAKAKFDKEKWLKEKQDKLDGLEQQITNIVESYKENPEQIAELLQFKQQFHSYSIRNCSLILKSNPYITFVASFKDWKDKGYNVKRGEKGIAIYYPAFLVTFTDSEGNQKYLKNATQEEKELVKQGVLPKKQVLSHFDIGYVFDISQTDCPVEEYPKYYNMGKSSYTHKEYYLYLKSFVESKGVEVIDKEYKSISLRGKASISENKIYTNTRLKDTEKLSTFTHEVGHNLLHHNDFETPTVIKEFEADCVSIMLQNKFGLEITDSRKKHLVDHFNMLPSDYDIMKSFSKVDKIYSDFVAELDQYIEKNKVVQLEQPTIEMQCKNDIKQNGKQFFENVVSMQDYHNYLCNTYGAETVLNALNDIGDNLNVSRANMISFIKATELALGQEKAIGKTLKMIR